MNELVRQLFGYTYDFYRYKQNTNIQNVTAFDEGMIIWPQVHESKTGKKYWDAIKIMT